LTRLRRARFDGLKGLNLMQDFTIEFFLFCVRMKQQDTEKRETKDAAEYGRSPRRSEQQIFLLEWTLLSLFFYLNFERNRLNEVCKLQETLSDPSDFGFSAVFSSRHGNGQ
jgi:hypothetical protein